MKRITILFLLLIIYGCEKDHSPTKPGFSDMGTIQIITEDVKEAKKSLPDSLKKELKTNKPAVVNQLEVRVLKNDNSILTSKSFTPSGEFIIISFLEYIDCSIWRLCPGNSVTAVSTWIGRNISNFRKIKFIPPGYIG